MFKAGQKVRVLTAKPCNGGSGTTSQHNFVLGSEVLIKEQRGTKYIVEGVLGNLGSYTGKVHTQYVHPDEIAPALSFTQPVFTAEGTPVQIVTTTGRDAKYPVLAYEGSASILSKFSLEGKNKNRVARRHLTNEVPKEELPKETPAETFVNIYGGGILTARIGRVYDMSATIGSGRFGSEEEATEAYKKSRREGNTNPRICVAKLVMVKGELPK